MRHATTIFGATIAGWRREGRKPDGSPEDRLYLVRGEDLVPIHVTSIQNGRLAGHNCWTEHCRNDRDGVPCPARCDQGIVHTRMTADQHVAETGRGYLGSANV